MEYRATFRSMIGAVILFSITSFLLIWSGISYRKPILFIFGIFFLALLLVIRFRFKVVVDEKQIQYTGFCATKTIPFSDVVHAGWMYEHGYSRDRFFGSFVYEILSKNDCIRINFKLFPLDSMSTVIQILEGLSANTNSKSKIE